MTIYSLAAPHYLNLLNHLIAIRSSSGFSCLRPGTFHIALQTHNTQHIQPRGWKKRRTNKHKQEGRFFFTFSLHSVLLRACILAKFRHSHQERRLILSRWLTWLLSPQVPTPHLTTTFLWLLPYPDFCWLLSSVDWFLLFCLATLPSLVFFRSRRRSRAQAFCVGFAPKQTKESD